MAFTRLARRLMLAALAAAALGVVVPSSASALTGARPFVVVLCNFSNQTAQPQQPSYYQQMFTTAGNGTLNAVEYFRDVSYGNVDLSGTVVRGWYTLGVTRDEWAAMSRVERWRRCAELAKPDVNFSNFAAALVVFPEADTTVPGAVDATQTSIAVADVDNFPTPPFNIQLTDGSEGNDETVRVTAISGTTLTVTRGAGGTTAKAHAAGARMIVPGDLVGFGPAPRNLGGTTYTLGGLVGAHDIGLSVFTHEMGHALDMDHSRKLSTSTADYNDCFDLMSVISCIHGFTGAGTEYGGSTFGGTTKGPGMNAVTLGTAGWMPAARSRMHSTCAGGTYTLAALGHPEAPGDLQVKLPASRVIATPAGGTTTAQHYSVEFRHKSRWDRGIPRHAVLVHLRGADNYSYWVDSAPGGTQGMTVGDEYVDAGQNTYVAVNAIDSAAQTAQVSVSQCRMPTVLTYTGATEGDFNDQVTLSGDLRTGLQNAPVPGKEITLSAGSHQCTATTNAAGRASCEVELRDAPGLTTASARFDGSPAFLGATGVSGFTITKEETQATYDGALTSDYHDPFTASAILTSPDDDDPVAGATVTFTLGASDSCTTTTDTFGTASCSITPTQAAGTYALVTSYAGDAYYEASQDSDAFEITRQETTTTTTGSTVILQGSGGATLSARLLEEGDPNVPVAGRTLTLGLGGESCTATTGADGTGSCTVTPSGTLGEQELTSTFAGDAFYEPSSDSGDTAIVFAFPSRGAFAIGSGADRSGTVTWWDDEWSAANPLAGGLAPTSFKGFASTVDALPTTSPATACGTSFTTRPGNSPPPVTDVPSYMGVLVTDRVTKSGSTISGTFSKIVVVRTDEGYAPSPGHPGTGRVVATFCG